MIGRPLAAHSPRAVREVLLQYGWDAIRADAAAGSVEPVVVLLEQVPEVVLEGLISFNQKLGIDLLTGEGWVLLAGSRSRLSAFARPWTLPPDLLELGMAVGMALPGDAPEIWQTARGPIALDRPIIAGILNLTPDSFSDGGNYLTTDAALARADQLLNDGADLLDVGGESTRPGAEPVGAEAERARVIPILEAIVRRHPGVHVSIDTVKSEVARAALDRGAAIVNDVSGFRLDPLMGSTVAQAGAGAILMHSRGGVGEMASMAHAHYDPDLISVVIAELRVAMETATGSGIVPDHIVLDPGLGFSKTPDQTLTLLDQIAALASLNRPLMIGPSRKRFLGAATGRPTEDRDRATATACVLGYERGVRLFRVHDVALTREALRLAAAVRAGRLPLP